MRRIHMCLIRSLAGCAFCSASLLFASPNATDFPLRVHIVQNSNHSHYRYNTLDWVDGEGRADLFENSNPRGFDYAFRCDERVEPSPRYETYPARWKKQDRELEFLQPVMGKPGSWRTCDLKVNMKETVYIRRNGLVDEESTATYKQWMEKRQYDPEHGKSEPVASAPAQAPGPSTAPPPPTAR
jgi:hypothetical protein